MDVFASSFLSRSERDLQRRIVAEFSRLSPFAFAIAFATGALASALALRAGEVLPLGLGLLLCAASGFGQWQWRGLSPSTLTAREVETVLGRLRLGATTLTLLASALFGALLAGGPGGALGLLLTGHMIFAVMLCVSLYAMAGLCIALLCALATPGVVVLLQTGEPANVVAALSLAAATAFLILLRAALGTLIAAHGRAAKTARDRAAENERALGRLLSLSQKLNAELSPDGRFMAVSPELSALLDLPQDRLRRTRIDAFVDRHEPMTAAGIARIKTAITAGNPFVGIEVLTRQGPSGRRRLVVAGMPRECVDGQVLGYTVWAEDRTDEWAERHREEALQARFDAFLSVTGDIFWETDAEGRIVTLWGDAASMTGASNKSLLGTVPFALSRQDAPAAYREDTERLRRAVAEQRPFSELIVPTNNGTPMAVNGAPRFSPQGEYLGFHGASRNVSAEIEAQDRERIASDALAEANRTLELRVAARTARIEQYTRLLGEVVETVAEGILVIGPDGSVELSNLQARRQLPAGEWIPGADFITLYNEGLAAEGRAGEALSPSALASGRPMERRRRTAGRRFVQETFTPRNDGGYVLTIVDRTRDEARAKELEALSSDLREARDAAEAASRAKSAFLANMSHEIRTPMNGVLGLTDALLATGLTPEQQELVDVICRSGTSLLSIINDILDFSKLEAGKLTLADTRLSIPDVVEDVVRLMKPTAQDKGLTLTVEGVAGIPPIRGDGGRIRQVLINLVGNALKFTDAGEVRVHVAADVNDTDVLLRFAIVDTGCGIPKSKLEAIFGEFEQVDGTTARSHEGTGLGLAICQRLSALMNGAISAESTLGKGSTFTFTARLPIDLSVVEAVPGALAPAARSERRGEGLSLLIAEDNQVNRYVIEALLTGAGYELRFATNGREAVDSFRAVGADLILMDVSMPEMDGYTATRAIREDGGPGTDVPIIGVTAHALEEDKARCFAAGMSDYLPKPIAKTALLDILEKHLSPSGAAQRREACG